MRNPLRYAVLPQTAAMQLIVLFLLQETMLLVIQNPPSIGFSRNRPMERKPAVNRIEFLTIKKVLPGRILPQNHSRFSVFMLQPVLFLTHRCVVKIQDSSIESGYQCTEQRKRGQIHPGSHAPGKQMNQSADHTGNQKPCCRIQNQIQALLCVLSRPSKPFCTVFCPFIDFRVHILISLRDRLPSSPADPCLLFALIIGRLCKIQISTFVKSL